MQILIPTYDRDALRFLWYKDIKLVHLRMCVHLFGGIWCAASSTYALRKTILDNRDIDPIVKEAVMNSMYVDNLTQSVNDVSQVYKIIFDLPVVLQSGGFLLTKFAVNDEQLLSKIPFEHRAKEVHTFFAESTCRALGLSWKVHEDIFCFHVPSSHMNHITRRTMLKFVASIFDPLGSLHLGCCWENCYFNRLPGCV